MPDLRPATASTAGLGDVLITGELAQRPLHAPDYKAESQALHLLARQMSHQPQAMLKALVSVALDLCHAGSAGVSLLEAGSGGAAVFRWAALAGAYEAYKGGTTPRDFSPCGTCLDREAPQLYCRPARYFTYLAATVPAIVEALVIPCYAGGRPLGTIWIVAHDAGCPFDAEDVRVMTGLADFSAAALHLSSARAAAEELARRERAARDAAEWEDALRRQAEAGLRASEQRLALALDAAGMGTWDWDLMTGRVAWGGHHERLFGYEPGAADGTHEGFRRRVHPDDLAAVEGRLARARESGQEYRDEYRVVWPDGSVHWVQGTGRSYADGSGRPVKMRGVVVETTDRRLMEEALRQQARDLTEADHNKDCFLAQLGHELRNPLAPLWNALHALREPGDDATRAEARAVAERQAQQLTRLVDDLLDLSRVAQGKAELRRARVDLAAIAARAIEAARPAFAARGHHLEVVLPAGPLWLHGDGVRLEQVLVNLLNNAAKYTDPGGCAWLTVGREGAEAVVRVRDTGIGLVPEALPRVWDLYAQVEGGRAHAEGGLGIGLALVRGLVELHGGKVEAHSDGAGKGSEFVVRLPSPVQMAAPAPPPAVAPALAESRALRILVVDDNRDAAATLALLLSRWGHRVAQAHDGPSALAAARAQRPEAVLLDIGLPGMGGHEVGRRLRFEEGLERTLLIALTGYGQAEDRARSREAGFDHHCVKPVDIDALRELLAGFRTPAAVGS